MIKEKIFKIATAATCIATLILPHTSTVLAALTNENPNSVNTVILDDSPYHGDGYAYRMDAPEAKNPTEILKVYDVNRTEKDKYPDEFYCLDATKNFPSGWLQEHKDGISYTRTIPDFFDIDLDQTTLAKLTPERYNSLCWLLNNLYLREQMKANEREVQKQSLLKAAFKDIIGNAEFEDLAVTRVEDIEDVLEDDAIEVIQQWAIWYFTNYGETTVDTQAVPIVNKDKDGKPCLPEVESLRAPETENWDSVGKETTKYQYMTILYRYLVTEAEKHNKDDFSTNASHPNITANNATIVEEGNYYKAGPFRVDLPKGCTDKYEIQVSDGTKAISNYTVNGTSNKTIPTNEDFYIYTAKNADIKTIKLTLTYYGTKASVWTPTNGGNIQPMILVTREGTPKSVEATLNVKPDLALRKYIVAVNGNEVSENRKPNITITNGKIEYKHRKNPVEVKVGDIVTYEITVYNEGNVQGTATEIVDYLPEGLEFVEGNEINQQYGWTANGNVVTTTRNKVLAPFANNHIDVDTVQIVCKVKDIATSGAILTNIAEIKSDNIDDIDSTPNSFASEIDTINRPDYKGNDKNPEDLSNPEYFYEGKQDDDDFEKVKVAGKPFDLSLQKFITKVNGKELSESREPKVSTAPLKNGSTNAEYAQVKTPVVVKTGDIVTYTIRVYNEGEVDGYAETVADYLPDGLGYLVNYKNNIDNYWAIPQDLQNTPVKLTENELKNLKIEDFTGETNLNDITVLKGPIKLTSTALSSSKSDNLIKAFDGSDKLNYKDIEVTCIVLADSNLRNIAEITKDLDSDKNEVEDRDSTPDTVNPDNYPGSDEKQDDNDYEILTMKKFDLALQKFITGLNDKEITDRVPKVSYADGKISYEHPETALEVNNGDNVTYTIRVYNEGEVDGYAAEIGDDIPNGLVFDSENEINKKYGWVMYDANGNVTTDNTKATEIRTDYLSKAKSEERKESALLTAFDTEKGTLSYLDVQAVFKVNATSANSTIINTAEITKDTDSDGNEIEDIDSIPDNKKEGEDDIDQERVHVGYFDLALQKDLVKAIVTEGKSTNEIQAVNGQLTKVEINRKKINSTIVKFVYNITITNEGTIAGYAKEIRDYIPEGLEFVETDNQNWKEDANGTIVTDALANTLIQPGETASVEVTLRWINNENNMGLKTNVAEISKDYNDFNDVDDIDSTPDNKVDGEDDIDDAPVILSISTGRAPMYIILTTAVLTIIGTGVVAIKKYVL